MSRNSELLSKVAHPLPSFSERLEKMRTVLKTNESEIADIPDGIVNMSMTDAMAIVNAYLNRGMQKLSQEEVRVILLRRKIEKANNNHPNEDYRHFNIDG